MNILRGISRKKVGRNLTLIIMIVLALIISGGCESTKKVFLIGVIAHPQRDADLLEGLKQGMADLGYVQGINVKYLYKDITVEDDDIIVKEVKELLDQNIDAVFVSGQAGVVVKELTAGTGLPVIFSGNADPVGDGMVKSLSNPGGNVTGVKAANCLSKTVEWLTNIKPEIKKIWMPYDPNDPFSVRDMSSAEEAAEALGVELNSSGVQSAEEAVKAIERLPDDVDALFINPSRVMFAGSDKIFQAAVDRGFPTGSSVLAADSALIVLTGDFYDSGKKSARLIDQIFKGAKPSELPIETPDAILTINLGTAEKIGLVIPEDVLILAKKIIR